MAEAEFAKQRRERRVRDRDERREVAARNLMHRQYSDYLRLMVSAGINKVKDYPEWKANL